MCSWLGERDGRRGGVRVRDRRRGVRGRGLEGRRSRPRVGEEERDGRAMVGMAGSANVRDDGGRKQEVSTPLHLLS